MFTFLEHFSFSPDINDFTKEEIEECLFFLDPVLHDEKEPGTGEAGAKVSSFSEIQRALAEPLEEETEILFGIEEKGEGHYLLTVTTGDTASFVTHFVADPKKLSEEVEFRVSTPDDEVDVAMIYDVSLERWIPAVSFPNTELPEPSWTYDYRHDGSFLRLVVPESEVDVRQLLTD